MVITARYGVNDLKADLQTMYRKAGLKNEGISFIFTDQQIADERFLVFMNDLLSSGNIPGLFPGEDMDGGPSPHSAPTLVWAVCFGGV